MVSRSVFCRADTKELVAVRSKALSNRANSAVGLSSLVRAAASSIASGNPSRRRYSAATSSALLELRVKLA